MHVKLNCQRNKYMLKKDIHMDQQRCWSWNKLLTKIFRVKFRAKCCCQTNKGSWPRNMSYLSNSCYMMTISSCIYFHWPWRYTVSLTKSTQPSMTPATNPANWIKFPFPILHELDWSVVILQQNRHFQSNKWPSGIFSFHKLHCLCKWVLSSN